MLVLFYHFNKVIHINLDKSVFLFLILKNITNTELLYICTNGIVLITVNVKRLKDTI